MREIKVKLKKGGRPFLGRSEFYSRDIVEGLTGCTPGQWVVVTSDDHQGEGKLLAIANPMAKSSAPVRVLKPIQGEIPSPEQYIEDSIQKALANRRRFSSLKNGSRLIYGDNDGMPGVIVDEYKTSVLIQVNTAGMDAYRDHMRSVLSGIVEKEVYFLDNEDYRKGEGLPLFEREDIPSLSVSENNLEFVIPKRVLQKIGYYYDHRINRSKLHHWLNDLEDEMKTGVDLFSYVGSWGLNALKANVGHMTFVDQGDFEETTEENMRLNGFEGKGRFVRANVFDWIKNCDQTFDVVISDPPAFSKSLKNKAKAVGGYQKLHRSLSRIVHKGSLLAIGSCTHGVSLEELDQTVRQGFSDSGFEIQLLDVGTQGPDHPISNLGDSSNYIKFILYRIL